MSPCAKTRITKLQRNKYIHPDAFRKKLLKMREGRVLLGKFLIASRMIKKNQKHNNAKQWKSLPSRALGNPRDQATPAGHAQFPRTARVPCPAKTTMGRKSFPARAPELSGIQTPLGSSNLCFLESIQGSVRPGLC